MAAAVPTVHKLAPSTSCHAWNGDKSQLAICPSSNEIWIYENCHDPDTTRWRRTHVLAQHDLLVSGVDWCPRTNLIVSCSHDRNAYVWSYDGATNRWRHSLVILRINRAALTVKWSPDGKKFAVGSGAKSVSVCFYEDANSWWVSKVIKSKKIRSSILSLDWHPNSIFLAAGCADYKCRVFSAHIGAVDPATPADLAPFGEVSPFATLIAEFEASYGSWVETVAWAPGGRRLAFVSHGSTLSVVTFAEEGAAMQVISCVGLPFLALTFVNDNAILAAGYDMNPVLFRAKGLPDGTERWESAGNLDQKPKEAAARGTGSGFSEARKRFEQATSRGVSMARSAPGAEPESDAMWTKHDRAINGVSMLSRTVACTSGLDGKVVLWDLAPLKL